MSLICGRYTAAGGPVHGGAIGDRWAGSQAKAAGRQDITTHVDPGSESRLATAFHHFFVGFDEFLSLEDRIAPFNLFEAVGMERAEIRHSRFLAYILDPRRRHGLGDAFLRRFLYRALVDVGSTDPMAAEAMIADLEGATVERERANIDILITVETERLVVAIENKIDAGETGYQLTRYHDWVEGTYGDGWRRVFLYLTPNGRAPSHAKWAPLSYATVVEALKWFMGAQIATLSDAVTLGLRHYQEMLERTVLNEDRNRKSSPRSSTRSTRRSLISCSPRFRDLPTRS